MKKTVKALAVLLAVCFCFSALVVIVGAAAGDVPKGETFYFGSFPQTEVKDKTIVDTLNAQMKKTGQDVISLDGVTYVSYRNVKNGKPGGPFGVYYGYYPYTEAYGYPTYWFRMEPIAWRVLDSSADGVLLLADKVLCTHAFNSEVRTDNTWANSDVRAWLNDAFMNTAFTAKEQVFLLDSSLTNANEPNPVHGTYGGEAASYAGKQRAGVPYVGTPSGADTVDKIFLPSFKEMTNKDYGFNKDCTLYGDFYDTDKYVYGCDEDYLNYYDFAGYYEEGESSGRQASATDFAKCQGVWANLLESTGKPVPTCRYWLRTGGYNSICAAAVLEDGRVSTGWDVDYDLVGIRPMMRVSPDAVADDRPNEPDVELPFHIFVSATEFHYKQEDVKFTADTDVTWTSSNPRIASIDPETGDLTINRVGTVTITATSKETGQTVEFKMEITYLWWQMLIRIFLFGWAWY